jgi:hypothetical protein
MRAFHSAVHGLKRAASTGLSGGLPGSATAGPVAAALVGDGEGEGSPRWAARSRSPAWRKSSTPRMSRRRSRPCSRPGCGTGNCTRGPCWRACAWPWTTAGRPPHPGPRRADQPARARPQAAGHHRRLARRPAPAHLPPGRAHQPAHHPRPGQGRARRRPLTRPAAPVRPAARSQHPRRLQGRQHLTGRRLDRRRGLVPARPGRQYRQRHRPRGPLGAPQRQPHNPGRGDVFRLLPAGGGHGQR